MGLRFRLDSFLTKEVTQISFKSILTKTRTRTGTPHDPYKTRRTVRITSIRTKNDNTIINIIILPENTMRYYCNWSYSLSLVVLMLAMMTTTAASDSVGAAGEQSPQPQLQLLLRGVLAARSAEVKVEEVQRTSATTAATKDRRRRLKAAKTETGDDPMKAKKKRSRAFRETTPAVIMTTDAATTTAAAVTTAITTATTPAVIICEDVCPTEQPDWRNGACDVEALGDCTCVYEPECFLECGEGKWYMACY